MDDDDDKPTWSVRLPPNELSIVFSFLLAAEEGITVWPWLADSGAYDNSDDFYALFAHEPGSKLGTIVTTIACPAGIRSRYAYPRRSTVELVDDVRHGLAFDEIGFLALAPTYCGASEIKTDWKLHTASWWERDKQTCSKTFRITSVKAVDGLKWVLGSSHLDKCSSDLHPPDACPLRLLKA